MKAPTALLTLQDNAAAALLAMPESTNAEDRRTIWRGKQRRAYSHAILHFMNGCKALGMSDASWTTCWQDAKDMADLELNAR